jgi:P-type Cu2+ transporter
VHIAHDKHNPSQAGRNSVEKGKAAKPGYPEHPEQQPAHPHAVTMHGRHAEHGGHDKHAGHSVAMFRKKFWLSLALTVPTLVWGHMLQRAFGYTAPHFPGSMD